MDIIELIVAGVLDPQPDPAEQRWRKDFTAAARAIPDAWLWHGKDFTGILPEYADRPLVKLYEGLRQTGYARGWLQ